MGYSFNLNKYLYDDIFGNRFDKVNSKNNANKKASKSNSLKIKLIVINLPELEKLVEVINIL